MILDDRDMTNDKNLNSPEIKGDDTDGSSIEMGISLEDARNELCSLSANERLAWGIKHFNTSFAITTSFGIQSAVLLNALHEQNKGSEIPVIWIDTGYLPVETYTYAEELKNLLNLNLHVIQSKISPARMEAIYGKLWESDSIKEVDKYHLIRKVEPLEEAFLDLKIKCWASGVRGEQTNHRKSMTVIDPIRNRLSLRPLLSWTKKDIFYYMEEKKLPQHPLFEKGYSTVGDWHSSGPDNGEESGRDTRFGGKKQECGIHTAGLHGDGI